MMSKCVIIMLTVMCTVDTVLPGRTSKLNTRIDIVERRVTTVAMETSLMKLDITQVLDNLFELNQTVLESAGECARCDNNHEQEKVYADDGVPKVAMEALEGFKNEKRWVRDEISKLQHTTLKCNTHPLDTEDRLTSLKKELEKQQQSIVESNKQQLDTEDRLTSLKKEFEKQQQSIVESNTQQLNTGDRLSRLKKEFEKQQQRIVESNKQQLNTEDRLTSLKKEFEKQQQSIVESNKQKLDTEDRLTSLKKEFEKQQQRIVESNKQQLDTEDRLTSLKKEFEKQINDLKKASKSLPQSVSPCPDDWKSYGKFCYQFFPDVVAFNEARTLCAKVGASVVDIQDTAEMNFVSNLDGGSNDFWIGLTDQEQEGIYKWERTNSEAQFTNWTPGQPDGGSQQDCVISMSGSNEWFDIQCDITGPFVCKQPRQHI